MSNFATHYVPSTRNPGHMPSFCLIESSLLEWKYRRSPRIGGGHVTGAGAVCEVAPPALIHVATHNEILRQGYAGDTVRI